ncbi:hypothetical protein LWI28_007695 [Acer negundo]|uniref:TauD/TfdA-like domain-containing protein n=1 Tax=Acer negundo TaxID=4023 RepID=A0AAD5NHB3_ACENE|nr:hypothetical protein LWI28_007695 [Acer negundo]
MSHYDNRSVDPNLYTTAGVVQGLVGLQVMAAQSAHPQASRKRDYDVAEPPRKLDLDGLTPFEKNFYVESPSVATMSEKEVEEHRLQREITVEGRDIPKPVKSFSDVGAAKLDMKLEWMEDGGVKSIMGPIPAIKYDKSRQRKIWFNSMVAAYTGWEDARNDPVKAVTFGDGEPLPADIIYECLKILEEECVAVPWQKGDVLLIDNLAVLHSRRPFNPPRRVLVASLCK